MAEPAPPSLLFGDSLGTLVTTADWVVPHISMLIGVTMRPSIHSDGSNITPDINTAAECAARLRDDFLLKIIEPHFIQTLSTSFVLLNLTHAAVRPRWNADTINDSRLIRAAGEVVAAHADEGIHTKKIHHDYLPNPQRKFCGAQGCMVVHGSRVFKAVKTREPPNTEASKRWYHPMYRSSISRNRAEKWENPAIDPDQTLHVLARACQPAHGILRPRTYVPRHGQPPCDELHPDRQQSAVIAAIPTYPQAESTG